MTAALLILSGLVLAGAVALAWTARKATQDVRAQFDALVRLYDQASATHSAERERAEERITQLLNRIQAPESAPYVETPDFGKQFVSLDNDEDFWKTREDLDG